jgi:enoyl-CoA hydratase/carnithine racemase
VVPRERLAEETLQLAGQISSAPAHILALGKRAFYEQLPLPCSQAYDLAQPIMVANAQVPDAQEGMTAFLEKRPARWE